MNIYSLYIINRKLNNLSCRKSSLYPTFCLLTNGREDYSTNIPPALAFYCISFKRVAVNLRRLSVEVDERLLDYFDFVAAECYLHLCSCLNLALSLHPYHQNVTYYHRHFHYEIGYSRYVRGVGDCWFLG